MCIRLRSHDNMLVYRVTRSPSSVGDKRSLLKASCCPLATVGAQTVVTAWVACKLEHVLAVILRTLQLNFSSRYAYQCNPRIHCHQTLKRLSPNTLILFYESEVHDGDQCLLGDSVTEVKYRRARLVLGWVTARED